MKHAFFVYTFVLCSLMMVPASVYAANEALTFEQARDIALQKIPGTVIDTERDIHNGAIVFEFNIVREDGTVMEIEIDSATSEVLELKVDKLGPGAGLPEAEIIMEEAQAIAIKHIEDETSGLRSVDVLEHEYTLRNKQFVYVFELRRGIKDYEVVVNANTGEIVEWDEED